MSGDPESASAAARTVEVAGDEAGQRIDNFLARQLKGVPRSRIYRVLRRGEVRVNSGRIRPGYRLRAGDRVRIPPLRTAGASDPPLVPPQLRRRLEAAVVYEDPAVVVVDKPAGLPVHAGTGVDLGLIEALRSLRPEGGGLELVHRLDRATSGCVILAKTRTALRELHDAMREGRIEKRYLALVAGRPEHERWSVDVALRPDRSGPERVMVAGQGGKPARTELRRIAQYAGAALVEARLPTGRTHQIRVHAAHNGHPLAGDPRYGDERFNEWARDLGLRRLFLHAHAVGFRTPAGGEPVEAAAPLPDDLRAILDRLEEHAT